MVTTVPGWAVPKNELNTGDAQFGDRQCTVKATAGGGVGGGGLSGGAGVGGGGGGTTTVVVVVVVVVAGVVGGVVGGGVRGGVVACVAVGWTLTLRTAAVWAVRADVACVGGIVVVVAVSVGADTVVTTGIDDGLEVKPT
jgi:hypothetical protein